MERICQKKQKKTNTSTLNSTCRWTLAIDKKHRTLPSAAELVIKLSQSMESWCTCEEHDIHNIHEMWCDKRFVVLYGLVIQWKILSRS